jgi:hypothetical protein
MSGQVLGSVLTVVGTLLLVSGLATMLWALYWPWDRTESTPSAALEPVIDLRKPVVIIDLTEDDQVWSAAIPASSSRREG